MKIIAKLLVWFALASAIPALAQTSVIRAPQIIQSDNSNRVPDTVKGASGQTANLTEWRASDNTLLCAISAAGVSSCSISGGVTGSGSSGQVAIFNGASSVTGDSDLTFATDTLTATKIIGSTSITDSGLTSGRVAIVGTAGLLADDSGMTFNGTTNVLTVSGSVNITDITISGGTLLTSTGTSAAGYVVQRLTNTDASGYERLDFYTGAAAAGGQASLKYAPGIFFAFGVEANDTTTPIVITNNNSTTRLTITAAAGDVLPGADNSQTFGDATHRWSNIFGTAGSFDTLFTSGGTVRILKLGTPTVGGSGTIVTGSKDSFGKATTATTGVSTITVTFSAGAFSNAPSCMAENETTANLQRASTTTTVLTIVGTTVAGDSIAWHCGGF